MSVFILHFALNLCLLLSACSLVSNGQSVYRPFAKTAQKSYQIRSTPRGTQQSAVRSLCFTVTTSSFDLWGCMTLLMYEE